MNPRQFLLLGGIILVALGVLGMYGLGPDEKSSALGAFFWLDSGENMAHLVLGVVALLAYFMLKDENMVKWLVILVGVVALLASVWGFLSNGNATPNVGVANLENPSDNILHLVVAVWSLAVGFKSAKDTNTA